MAEQQNDALLQRTESADTVIQVGRSPRDGSTAHALKIAGITMLVCMLVAGQGLSVYYVMNQHGQIKDLENTAHNLKMQLSRRPSGSSPAQVVRMPMYSMPLLMDMKDDGSKKIPMTKLQNTAKVSVEKQVKELLQDQDFPQFNETFLDNLKALRSQMEESNWKSFETWMYQWMLFQMAQQSTQKPTPAPMEQTSVEAPKLMTKCQLDAEGRGSVKPGFYTPQCDEQGNYKPIQCWFGTGYCWCVDKNGVEIPNTKVRGHQPSCDGAPAFDRIMALPSIPRMMRMKEGNKE